MKRLLIILLSALLVQTAFAARAKGGYSVMTLHDGSQKTLMLCGDEHFSYYRTPTGELFLKDDAGAIVPISTEEAQQRNYAARKAARRNLPTVKDDIWAMNPDKHSIVILVEFSDLAFSMDDPKVRYDSIFNRRGYNEGNGVGCVADYFRDQSGGLCDVTFDIYGPVQVDYKAKNSYHATVMRAALLKLIEDLGDEAASLGAGCDWDYDGTGEQVVFVYAGYGGNESASVCTNSLWPCTSTFSSVKLPSGLKFNQYTCSAEMWSTGDLCGIGTICHEYTHTLGLPDIYPAHTTTEYSIADEWDLMDGGNFTDNGWCPCNFSAHEKMLLGWLTPVEIDEPLTVTGLKPVADGGDAYLVRHTDNEFYLLENRQWKGWDLLTPGHGLLVAHVDYDASVWKKNRVNDAPTHHRYDYVHADNINYTEWAQMIKANPDIYGTSPYKNGHSQLLSTTPYPYYSDNVLINNALTDLTKPASTMFNANAEGLTVLEKPITEIAETEDGLISFMFMGGSTLKGDANGDGIVDAADYVAIAHHIMGMAPDNFNAEAADINEDGKVNVADCVAVIHIVLAAMGSGFL